VFGLSFSEILVISLIALLVLGPEKLPEAAKTFGQLSAKFKKFTQQWRKDFYNSLYPPGTDPRKELEQVKRELAGVRESIKKEVSDLKKIDGQ
jgi:sec-independent protein translocase protein TatB